MLLPNPAYCSPAHDRAQVVPDTQSRSALGETCDGGLLEIFHRDFGPEGSPAFEAARHNFIRSEAGCGHRIPVAFSHLQTLGRLLLAI